jgi:hypothetical protein
MSAMPALPRDASGEPGYLMLPRGQAFTGYSPAKHGPLWNYRLLPGRAGEWWSAPVPPNLRPHLVGIWVPGVGQDPAVGVL